MGFFETLKNHLQELFFSFLMCAFYLVGFFVTFFFLIVCLVCFHLWLIFTWGQIVTILGETGVRVEPKASVA